jgi:hypothetical protein
MTGRVSNLIAAEWKCTEVGRKPFRRNESRVRATDQPFWGVESVESAGAVVFESDSVGYTSPTSATGTVCVPGGDG